MMQFTLPHSLLKMPLFSRIGGKRQRRPGAGLSLPRGTSHVTPSLAGATILCCGRPVVLITTASRQPEVLRSAP